MLMEAGVCFAADACSFREASSSLAFGNLDPLSTANAAASVTVRIQCTGNPIWRLTSDNGLHPSGSTKRMKHQTQNAFIPYTLTFFPTAGDKNNTQVTGTGLILNSDYVDADAGSYSDSVRLTIMP
jgi:spore coat protein U-like protein